MREFFFAFASIMHSSILLLYRCSLVLFFIVLYFSCKRIDVNTNYKCLCKNGGYCTPVSTGGVDTSQCNCPPNYIGIHCDTKASFIKIQNNASSFCIFYLDTNKIYTSIPPLSTSDTIKGAIGSNIPAKITVLNSNGGFPDTIVNYTQTLSFPNQGMSTISVNIPSDYFYFKLFFKNYYEIDSILVNPSVPSKRKIINTSNPPIRTDSLDALVSVFYILADINSSIVLYGSDFVNNKTWTINHVNLPFTQNQVFIDTLY